MEMRPLGPDEVDSWLGAALRVLERNAVTVDDLTVVDLRYVGRAGEIRIAVADRHLVGFAGAIEAHGAVLLTDLFVAPEHHGRGIGTALLHSVLAGRPTRLTFASSHPAALAAYDRAGMRPRWRLRYLRGRNVLGFDSGSITCRPTTGRLEDLPRSEVVEHLVRSGAVVLDLVDEAIGEPPVGIAVVRARGDVWDVVSVISDAEHGASIGAVLAASPTDVDVTVCVPEWSAASPWLSARGFIEFDADICCHTDDVSVPRSALALHPGLA